MDNNIVEENMQKVSCNILIHDAMILWYRLKDKSFIYSFKETMDLRGFRWEENGEVVEGLSARDTLLKVIDALNTTIVAQIACYAFEIAKETANRDDTRVSFRNNDKIMVSEDINSDFELLNFIRNAISHNNDMADNLQYTFSQNDRYFTFTSNKEGKENSKVVIGKHELVVFLGDYIVSLDCMNNFMRKPEINLDNVYSNKSIDKVEDFIGLRNKENGELLVPDEYQEEVVKDIVTYLRNNKVDKHRCVDFAYPYKQNVLNNYFRMYDFYYLVTGLYRHRMDTYSEYMNYMLNFGTFYDREIRQQQDIPGLFIVNRMFQVFSSTDNEVLNYAKKMFEYNRFNKIRNSLMHGTYYKDFYGNYYFYDAPRGKKTEEQLKFLDKMTIDEFRLMDRMFHLSRKIEQTRLEDLTEEEFHEKMLKMIKKRFGI